MPYAKKYAARKIGRWYRKRRYRRNNAGVQALRMVRTLKRNMEVKKFTRTAQNVVPSVSSPVVWDLLRITEGDQANQRDGIKITVKSIYMRLLMMHPDDGATAPAEPAPFNRQSMSRLILVRDKRQRSDTNPTAIDLLSSVELDSPLNYTTPGRFQVLWDKVVITSPGDKLAFFIKKYWKCNYPAYYNDTGSTDIESGGLYLIMFGSGSGAADDDSHNYDFNIRCTYTDN